ncbi:MAG: gamma-glutamyl-gamma-aminobutyrate hydrolase family protein, partial [Bdellovibrionales bacterium]|nr:gamma-glutamyl-gamma-aminobutyrate hydrolase family protein [Bdellovibrionales bacterium]
RSGGDLHQLHGNASSRHFPRDFDGDRWIRVEHTLSLHRGSLIGEWLDGEPVRINSLHEQGARTLGTNHLGLQVAARSSDGIIEVVERDAAGSLIVGVQGHPEALAAKAVAADWGTANEDSRLAGQQWLTIFREFLARV